MKTFLSFIGAIGIFILLFYVFVFVGGSCLNEFFKVQPFDPIPQYKFGDIVIFYHGDLFRVGQIVKIEASTKVVNFWYTIRFRAVEDGKYYTTIEEECNLKLYQNSLMRQI